MSDTEIPEKDGRTTKNGQLDLKSQSSAVNVSNARSKVKAFLKADTPIMGHDRAGLQ